jgi:CDP-diacylglycerol--serine O-phosphatidyltransferase
MKNGRYLLPNLFTTGNLLCGFASVVSSINGQYAQAATAILIAVLLDGLDGKVARLTNSSSAFGVEYDSLADVLSFGMAPCLLLYASTLHFMGSVGWVAAGMFVICGALRLARFNVQAMASPHPHFTGLPIPGAAGVVASAVLLSQQLYGALESVEPGWQLSIVVTVMCLALLMVSNVRYESLKGLQMRRAHIIPILAGLFVTILISAFMPALALFLIFFGYAISGPIEALLRWRRPKEEVATAEQ